MPIYSHSRLGTFEQCRLKYKYTYIDHIRKEGQSVEAFLGQRFHDVMEKLYAERKFKLPTLDELQNHFNLAWDKNWNNEVFIVRKDRTTEDYRKLGLKAVEDYYKRYNPFEEGKMLGVEKQLVFHLDENGQYRVQGYIDRLMEKEDGHYEIHDYKTAGSLPEQSQLDQDRQLALYDIAIRQKWNDVKKVDLVWHYVIFDKEFRSSRTQEELVQLKKETVSLIDTVETTANFPPHQSSLCNWCDYQDICPLFSHRHKTEVLPVNEYLKEDGVALVNQYASLEAEKKELKEKIKEIDGQQEKIEEAANAVAEKEGASQLYGSDKILKIKDEVKIIYPKSGDKNRNKFLEYLKTLGFWDEIVDVQWNSLKKVAIREKWDQKIPEGLKNLVTIETEKKISLSKKKDDDN